MYVGLLVRAHTQDNETMTLLTGRGRNPPNIRTGVSRAPLMVRSCPPFLGARGMRTTLQNPIALELEFSASLFRRG